MSKRNIFNLFILIMTFFLLSEKLSIAKEAEEKKGEVSDLEHLKKIKEQDRADEGIKKGIKFLITQQDNLEGSFYGSLPNTITGLSCLALMAAGQFPGRSTAGENLRKGILFLTRVAESEDGYFGNERKGRMYAQGICTLALSEAYGMLEKEEENHQIRRALNKALEIIIRSQCKIEGKEYGGWRHHLTTYDSDLSVTVWQALALRSAQNCQLKVPEKVIKDARDYVRSSYNETLQRFTYRGNLKKTPSMAAAGVVSLKILGGVETQEDELKIKNSARMLLTHDPLVTYRNRWFYYQSYYLATAANMMGGEYRKAMLPRIEKTLLDLQLENGEFGKYQGYIGGAYSTAFAIICLSVRYHYLPIFQE